MATVREGTQGVLLVVDVQVDVMKDAWEAPRETVIGKHFNSSFEQTALSDELARVGASHITLAGVSSNWCIRATAYGALERGYDLTLVSDAHTTDTLVLENGTRIEAASVVDELNLAMTWISDLGRSSGTATAERAAFAAPSAAG